MTTTFEFSLTPAGGAHQDELTVSAADALRAAGFDVASSSDARIRLRVTASDIYDAWHAVFDARRAIYDAVSSASEFEVRSVRSKALL